MVKRTDSTKKIAFLPGTIVATVGALEVADKFQIAELLRRHLSGDWGDVDKDDAKANDRAVTHGERILSSYSVKGEKLWILTEHDRSATTILTPGEY